MKSYFEEIKKVATKFKNKPVNIEMENIVLDTKKNSEKERDYVKLLYSYRLDDLYCDKEVSEKIKEINATDSKKSLPEAKGALTPQGNIALQMVKETTQNFARENIEQLINANKQVRTEMAR